MKTRIQTTTLIALIGLPLAAAAQDLPFDSGSTGADGAFDVDLWGSFGPRQSFVAAYDSTADRLLITGGINYNTWKPLNSNRFGGFLSSSDIKDTRRLEGDTWVTASGTSPIYSYLGAGAYDPGNNQFVYYGGRTATFGTPQARTQIWDGTQWTTPNATQPGGLSHLEMCYDAANGELILFGGWAAAGSPRDRNGTWAWDGAAWVNKAPTTAPPQRYSYGMCFDDTNDEIVLFGGYSDSLATQLNDTWVFKDGDWSQKSPASSPSTRHAHALGFDPGTGKVVMFGGWSGEENGIHRDTWIWDGNDWVEASGSNQALTGRSNFEMVTDTAAGVLYLLGGFDYAHGTSDDIWRWDGTNERWLQVGGSIYKFDMSEKPDGVWNYTSINVPDGVTVELMPDETTNKPAVWLATDQVTVDGDISVDGEHATFHNNHASRRARGGPGGYPGGIGGTREEVYNTVAGTPGIGPGGGNPGSTLNAGGAQGTHEGVYGNVYVIPQVGGSGGGGAAAGDDGSNMDGGNGGGGGGVFYLASSRDVTVNGTISANGGWRGFNSNHRGPAGGHGAGGAVKIVADRLYGTGTIQATSADGTITNNRGGYVRLESYLRQFDISGTVTAGTRSNSAPILDAPVIAPAVLVIASVDGTNVAQPPTGDFFAPDVVFSEPGSVNIVVTSNGVPDATPITLRITAAGQVIDLPAEGDPDVLLAGGSVTFTATVPAGFGTIQAFATYDVDTTP